MDIRNRLSIGFSILLIIGGVAPNEVLSNSQAIQVSPERALVDVPLTISVTGLEPQQPITLQASVTDVSQVVWSAQANFVADDNGTLDLKQSAPVSGSYTGADPMGLVWSMTPEGDKNKYTWPAFADPFIITFKASINGKVIATSQAERTCIADNVRREVVRNNGLFGTLYLPSGKGPHPAIILVSGSGGGLSERSAAIYAAHGYAALALAYFNYETLPKALINIPLEYFGKAIKYLQERRDIDGKRLAIMGGSRGGELSLLLGAYFPQFKAVIAMVPSGLVWSGIGGAPEDGVQPAWTYNGKAIPFMQGGENSDYNYMQEYNIRGEPMPLTPGFVKQIERNPESNKKATIPVERINGAVLMISGEDDQMWPSCRMAEISMERLRQNNFPYHYEHVCYPGAGHLIGIPFLPATCAGSKHPVAGSLFAYGGDAVSNEIASVNSWQKILDFLDKYL